MERERRALGRFRGRPDFNLLQNFQAEASRIHYYIFDLLVCKDRDLTRLPLTERRALLESLVQVRNKRIRVSDCVEAGATELLAAVRPLHWLDECSFRSWY